MHRPKRASIRHFRGTVCTPVRTCAFLHLGIQILVAVPSSFFCVSDRTLLLFFSRHNHTNSTKVIHTKVTAASSNIRIYETAILFLRAASE